jgi:hypothetical protein
MWGSRLTTTKGRELAKTTEANNYSFLSTGEPIYWPMDPNKNTICSNSLSLMESTQSTQMLSKDIKLNIRLKDSDNIGKATSGFIKLLQEAAQQATPPIKPRPTLNDIR